MSGSACQLEDTGLEVLDLRDDAAFAQREPHLRDVATQMQAIERLTRAFVEHPDTLLQELVNAAVELCGADSAGVSTEKTEGTDEQFYEWVATAGQYTGFLHAILPRSPSACGICLERGGPQLFRVNQRFFDILGVDAPLVTDGLLLPWEVDGTRGTIFVMAHGREEAFDAEDCKLMRLLADFAMLGVRHLRQQRAMLQQAAVTAAAVLANDLAHQINNPLQSLTNLLFLAQSSPGCTEVRVMAEGMTEHVDRLARLVSVLLTLPSAR